MIESVSAPLTPIGLHSSGPIPSKDLNAVVTPELERLLNELVPFAERSLSDHGWFDPYGGTITVDTAIEHISVETESGDQSTAEELFNALVVDLRKGADEGAYVATAIFSDVQITAGGTKTFAINVCLEHVCGVSVEVNIPYRQNAESAIEYGESVAKRARPRVFS